MGNNTPQTTIDTSDPAYAAALATALTAYEQYLVSGCTADLHKWVRLDRECNRILRERQEQKQRNSRGQS